MFLQIWIFFFFLFLCARIIHNNNSNHIDIHMKYIKIYVVHFYNFIQSINSLWIDARGLQLMYATNSCWGILPFTKKNWIAYYFIYFLLLLLFSPPGFSTQRHLPRQIQHTRWCKKMEKMFTMFIPSIYVWVNTLEMQRHLMTSLMSNMQWVF